MGGGTLASPARTGRERIVPMATTGYASVPSHPHRPPPPLQQVRNPDGNRTLTVLAGNVTIGAEMYFIDRG